MSVASQTSKTSHGNVQPKLQLPATQIRPSLVHGNGVFATRHIPKGQTIEQCPCIVLEDGWHQVHTVLHDYLYCWPQDGDGRAIVLGNGSLFNHDPDPNAMWITDLDSKSCIYTAARDIKQDEEVFIDYGSDYWTTQHANAKSASHTRIALNQLLQFHHAISKQLLPQQ